MRPWLLDFINSKKPCQTTGLEGKAHPVGISFFTAETLSVSASLFRVRAIYKSCQRRCLITPGKDQRVRDPSVARKTPGKLHSPHRPAYTWAAPATRAPLLRQPAEC